MAQRKTTKSRLSEVVSRSNKVLRRNLIKRRRGRLLGRALICLRISLTDQRGRKPVRLQTFGRYHPYKPRR